MPINAEGRSQDLARIFRSLLLIRRTEEAIARIYPSDKIKSPVHLSIGQEAVAVGVCDPLSGDDVVSGTYRGHATYLAKGGDLKSMMAELYGKASGCAEGKGGSMHLIDMGANILGCSAVVGTNIPVALGFALAARRRRTRRVVAAFFGDGATDEGVFYESLNFAALHRLPVIFVCENNGLAIHTPTRKRWAHPDVTLKAKAFGIPAHRFETSDVLEIRDTVAGMLPDLRAGQGPVFLECRTYRWREHVGPQEDFDAGYRARSELERWQAEDAVKKIGDLLTDAVRQEISSAVDAEIADAIAFAESSPFPQPDRLSAHVFAA